MVGALTWITAILNDLPWKQTEINAFIVSYVLKIVFGNIHNFVQDGYEFWYVFNIK